MKKIGFIVMIIMTTTVSVMAAGQVGEWNKVRESEGITGWSRTNSLSSVDEVRAEGIINAPVPVVEAILRDTPAMKKFMFMCTDAYSIEPVAYKNTKDAYYVYFSQGLPWPFEDRYGLGRIDWMLDKSVPGALVVKCNTVNVPFTPPKKNMFRMPIGDVTWLLVPTANNTTKLTYQVLADPAGNLPSAVVNMLMKNVGVTTLKNIRKLAKDEPYRSAKTIVTTTPNHD
ncbi:MAG: START domain-containing protein [Syntrophaceae bacterium]